MAGDIYDKLADALNVLPTRFPRTQSGIEIKILGLLFSPDEAAMASELGPGGESLDQIAKRVGLSTQEAEARLHDMAEKGMVVPMKKDGRDAFRLNTAFAAMGQMLERNIISSLRISPLDNLNTHQLIHLREEYLSAGAYVEIHKVPPPDSRVLPAQKALEPEQILPYDDIREIIRSAKSFGVAHCNCRLEKDDVGERKCDFPTKTCIFFSPVEGEPYPWRKTCVYDSLSKEQFLEIFDNAEEIGLVHTMSNVINGEGYGWICNCCGDCCIALRGITQFGLKNAVAPANYFSVIDQDKCNQCGLCVNRCQVHAISNEGTEMVVNRDLCIGCGICVTGCPIDAVKMERKQETEIVQPPADYAAWSQERLHCLSMTK